MKGLKKFLVFLLALVVIVSAISLVAAAAADSGAESGESISEEGSAEDGKKLSIASKNIKYSSYLYILVAIAKTDVPEGAFPSVSVSYYEDGKGSYVISDFELQTISLGGASSEYYVFETNGIIAADIARTVYLTPTLTSENGDVTLGEVLKYSIIEYCYERLLDDGFALFGEGDGMDYFRKNLYEALIEYGKCAFDLLGKEDIPSPEDYKYLSLIGSYSDFKGSYTAGERISVAYNPSLTPKDHLFDGWEICKTNSDGSSTYETVMAESITVTLGECGTLIRARYLKDPVIQRAEDIAAAEIEDAEKIANQWIALERAMISKGYSEENAARIILEMKTLYTLYGNEMVDWVASLYAKGYMDIENGVWAGGFYASVAGRDAYGFGPDVQSTVQLLRFLQQSGVISSVSEDIPEWMQREMVYFAKSLQHENGYFYHPQWGKEFTDTKISRRGRDLGWATSILSFFGAKPEYDTPNSIKGDGISADEYLELIGVTKPEYGVRLTEGLGTSCEYSVSRVVLAAAEEDSSTAYLKTLPAFVGYLLETIEPGMRTNQYSTGNLLNATDGQISYYSKLNGTYTYTEGDEAYAYGATAEDFKRFEGLTMTQMVDKVLVENINPITGLYGGWISEGNWSDTLNFSHSNGFFKVISILNGDSVVYPYAAEAAVSLIDNLTNPDLPSRGNACEVYNVWNAINSLDSNPAAKNTVYAIVTDTTVEVAKEGDAGAEEMTISQFIAKSLEVRGADAVRITFEKIKGYKKSDGAFSHSYTSGGTQHQGCPIAPAGNKLGDVDATCIASTGLVRSLFDAFNLGSYRPSFFGKADYMRFIDMVEAADPVYKPPEDVLNEDFEDDLYKNKFEGDFDISDGKLTVSGKTVVSVSPLSTCGTRLALKMKLSAEGTTLFELTSGEHIVDSFTLTGTESEYTLKRVSNGSYASIESNDGELTLYMLYYVNDGVNVCEIYSDTVMIMRDYIPLPENEERNITSLTLTSDSATIDDFTFGLISHSYSIRNDSGIIDFSGFVDGELDVEMAEGSIAFTNQTSGEDMSYALIITENNNKFLRLEDNWSVGSSAQNYFDFKNHSADAKISVFEAKMRISKISGGVIPITVLGKAGAAYYCGLNVTSDGYLKAGVANKKASIAENLILTDTRAEDWFTVRVEYKAASAYSEDTFLCSIYINGTLIDSDSARCDGLTYCSASDVAAYRMACDTNWKGNLDYDDIYVGSKADYGITDDTPESTHIHLATQEITDFIDYTCTEDGSYTLITKCSSEDCGKVLSTVYIKLPAACRAGEAVIENTVPAGCYTDGSYDEVIYCKDCKSELSRVTLPIPAAHTMGEKMENRKEPTCAAAGSYELVRYCTVCGEEYSREQIALSPLYHRVSGGACTVCGETNLWVLGIESFEDIEAIEYLTGTARHNFDKTENGSFVSIYGAVANTNAAVVTEDNNKYLRFEKITNNTAASTWVDIIRDTTDVVDEIVFESRVKYDITTIGGGIYLRFYTGRTLNGDGARVVNYTLSRSGGYVTFNSIKTHAKIGEWFTMRATMVKTEGGYLFTFMVKNESAGAITYSGKSYAVGEFIPYFSTSSLLVTPSSVNDINAFTFMQSTGSLCTVNIDNTYLGGAEKYISRK